MDAFLFKKMTDNRYSQRGVSADKEDVHDAIKNVDKGLFEKSFCKIVPDYLTNDEDYCLVMHADGAGTNANVATVSTDVLGDSSPQLGGNLDTNSQNILIDDAHFIGDESGNEQLVFQTTATVSYNI